jgi:hypothetical protein
MLNLEDSLKINQFYIVQRDFYSKILFYSLGIFFFIELLRSQISEIKLLQLIPGFYLVLLFTSLLVLLFFSDFFIRIPFVLDNKKEIGSKTKNRLELILSLKNSFFFFFTGLFIIINTIIPLSLDSFNSYGEKTIENIWSFDEVLSLEILLFFFLSFLSQYPLIFLSCFTTEKFLTILPLYWKNLSFLFFLFSGLITPTIDGYTQINFAFSAFFLYFILLNLIQKQSLIKYIGINTLN